MTLEEASQVFYINQEIKCIQKELQDLEASRRYYRPTHLSDMPKGRNGYSNLADGFLEKQKELEDMLGYAIRKLQKERMQFEVFLNSVDNAETRLILRLRCINNMGWKDIGEAVGMDRRTASRKFYGFFKFAHNARHDCGNI